MADSRIFGREQELAGVSSFLDAEQPARALVLAGGAGIGKTTLWEAGVALARRRGLRVLAARPRDAEAHLSLVGLGDLLDGVDLAALDGLPGPQRHALAVATLRAEAAGQPEPRAVAAGLLSALRALAAAGPLLVAVDDAQWLDRDSAVTVGFAARRLNGHPVRFLITTRSAGAAALEQAFEPQRRRLVDLGPLSLPATRRMLSAQLGLVLPRRVLAQVHDAAQGNPLFALELGRALVRRAPPEIGEDLRLPASLDALLGARVDDLPGPQRRALLAVALSAGVSRRRLEAIATPEAVQAALDARVLVAAGDHVRPEHPLLAATAAARATPAERRALHRELAREAADEPQRVLHLALAHERPDAPLAARLASAAATAADRGAAGEAVTLAGHALRLTADGAAEWPERLLALAEHLEAAGELDRLSELLAPKADALPPGEPRVRAHLLLAEGGHIRHADQHAEHLARALAESGSDPALRAPVLALQSIHASVTCVERIGDAEALALEALPHGEALAPGALAWARALRGKPVEAPGVAAGAVERSVDRVAAVRLVWRGDMAGARAALTALLDEADERGETWSYLVARLHQCELELRAGHWAAASRALDEWVESADVPPPVREPVHARCRALLAAGRGDVAEAERAAGDAIAGAEATGIRWQLLEGLRARGLARLLAHEPARAAADLRAVWRTAEREGVEDPGAFPVAPDLVEALLDTGERDEARAVTARLRELADAQRHPWGQASAHRCAALLEEDWAAAEEVAARYERLGLPFDRARSLLALGRAARGRQRWRAARGLLAPAAEAFGALGSAGWAQDARAELARVAGRRAHPAGQLTPSERRVAELAADGMSNKEIARTLFLSVHTVEAHLSHSYAKLGVRSRTQLARAID